MQTFDTKIRLNNERIRKLKKLREWSGMGKQAIVNSLIDQAYNNARTTICGSTFSQQGD